MIVTTFSTDAPLAVRFTSGTRLDGQVSVGQAGAVQIAGLDGTLSTSVDKIAAGWAAGGKDPSLAALERHWAYEAAVDVAGKMGNREQPGTAASVRATLKTLQDTLQFYSAYDEKTLALIDSDHDGRIAVPDVVAAVRRVSRESRRPRSTSSSRNWPPTSRGRRGARPGKLRCWERTPGRRARR